MFACTLVEGGLLLSQPGRARTCVSVTGRRKGLLLSLNIVREVAPLLAITRCLRSAVKSKEAYKGRREHAPHRCEDENINCQRCEFACPTSFLAFQFTQVLEIREVWD